MDLVANKLGPWIIECPIGKGGMASVFRCRHESGTGEERALKVLYDAMATLSRRRFGREAEILFALHHPAIVEVVDIDLAHQPPYLVMELVPGETLVDHLRRAPLEPAHTWHTFRQLADGLGYAHALGVRHRDVKPANIMLCPDGSARLLDFGVALLEGSTRLTSTGVAMGTVQYMPPEVLRDPNPDGIPWDIYSLGVVMYEALTGRPAFVIPRGSENKAGWLQVLRDKQRHPPLDPGAAFPDSVRDLIQRATVPDPRRRLPSMSAFVSVLNWMERPQTSSKPEPAVPEPASGSETIPLDLHPPRIHRYRSRSTRLPPSDVTAILDLEAPSTDPSLDAYLANRPSTRAIQVRELLRTMVFMVVLFTLALLAVTWWLRQSEPSSSLASPPAVAPPSPSE